MRGFGTRTLAQGVLVGLAAATFVLVVPSSATAADSFTPVADAYVDASTPATNYGTRVYLRADASPERVGYLKFQVADVVDASSAVLRLHVEASNTNSTGLQVRSVASNSWSESSVTFNTAPAFGAVLDSTGPLTAGQDYDLDVSAAVTGNGTVSLALTTPSGTAIKITSREGSIRPLLIVPAPTLPDHFTVTPIGGGSYRAVADGSGLTYTGSVKFAVESAVHDLVLDGDGGTLTFTAGTFDLGEDYLKFYALHDVVFEGAGMNSTLLKNFTNVAADTEPFNFTGAFGVTIRDLEVIAGGAARTTSDALDFDQGNNSVVDRVKISSSRGRGIVFDGKNLDWTSHGNLVRDCVITNTLSRGIELLASSNNRIEGCTITNVGSTGIQANKASTTADQANKKSNDNVIIGNTVTGAGGDGISINSGDRNQVINNVVTNSSRLTTGRDGIRIFSSDSIDALNNRVENNVATDTQSPKRQNYGLNINASRCRSTVVGGNNFAGNKTGPIKDLGTGTIYL